MNAIDLSRFSPKWQFRFNFFQQHGAPKEPGFKQAWKALSFGDRLKINMNFFAFFFGPIYLLILGMWRKALSVLGISIALGVVTAFLTDWTSGSMAQVLTFALVVVFLTVRPQGLFTVRTRSLA